VLPAGAGRHDVGAGAHRWSFEVPPADLARWCPLVSSATSIAELRADSAAWKVLVDRFPDVDRIPAGSELEQQSVRELFAQFGSSDQSLLDELDRELADLTGSHEAP
jgi:hypothetical protein